MAAQATSSVVDGDVFGSLPEHAERVLAAAVRHDGEALQKAARATLDAGGKRVRPALVLVCGMDDGKDSVVRAAVAVELVHMATLVHDDLVDRAPLRRGRPTVAARWGSRAAVATGDFLFSRAFSVLAENGRADELDVLAAACLDLARGELVQREDACDASVRAERYLRRCELKTASLFGAACHLGALEGGRDPHATAALAGFGRKIGVAFQILDDVLDVAGDPERTGKPVGTDLREGTVTLPLILAEERRPGITRKALAARDGDEIALRCREIEATGALTTSRRLARDLVDQGLGEIHSVGIEPETRAALREVALAMVDRYT